MNADDIFFEYNGEKKLIATTGYTSKPFIGLKKTANLNNLRLFSPDSKNALPLRVKINNNTFALGNFPDGIVIKYVRDGSYIDVSLSDRNISYVYDLTNNSLKLIATIDFSASGGCYFKEQNFYIVNGYREVKSGGAYTFVPYYAISFDGCNWNTDAFNKILCSISYNGRVAFLVEEWKEYPFVWGGATTFYSVYTVEDGEFVIVKVYALDFKNVETIDFDGNVYVYDLSGSTISYYMYQPDSTYSEDERFVYTVKKTKIEINSIPSYPDIWSSRTKDYSYYSRILGKTFTLSINRDNKKILITDSNGNEVNSVIAEGARADGYINITVLSAKESVSEIGIAEGTYTIEEFASLLQNYISENSYRVLASACTISDGNFTVSMAAGQRIWICTKGESPNYAKTIRFVDDENDYSGSTVGYVSGSAYYDFYSFGTTGLANFDKYEGRNGYYDVSSYNVTITGGISFL